MRKVAVFIIYAGIAGSLILSGLSLITPLVPSAEMANHFRPFIIAGLLLLPIPCVLLKQRQAMIATLALLFLNVSLTLVAWGYSSPTIARNNANVDGTKLKLVSFNIHFNNSRLDKAEQFLKNENADIVVFQEVTPKQISLLERLKEKYPHQISCASKFNCKLAMISRLPWEKARTRDGTSFSPPVVLATFHDQQKKPFTIIGTHISWPLRPTQQDSDLKWLSDFRKKEPGPLIIAGDFNHTPWSWRLTRFAHSTGLKRHATFTTSWPAGGLFPVFLIDHFFSSEEVQNIETWTGPDLNSDHLPVISVIGIK